SVTPSAARWPSSTCARALPACSKPGCSTRCRGRGPLASRTRRPPGGPRAAPSRRDVVDALLAQGLTSGLAEWMTTNLKREGERYTWLFAVDAIEELMADYFRVDLWPLL